MSNLFEKGDNYCFGVVFDYKQNRFGTFTDDPNLHIFMQYNGKFYTTHGISPYKDNSRIWTDAVEDTDFRSAMLTWGGAKSRFRVR
ncbi:MAG: hypothetical protein R3250_03025 [Melioribacteraceae bacterium]|nr:hypothetical protein [Melioribacteraceae bacterium]